MRRPALAAALAALGASAGPPAVVPFGDKGEISICSESIIRVTHRPTPVAVRKTSLVARTDWPSVHYTVSTEGDVTVVETSKLQVRLSGSTGLVAFRTRATGRLLLSERGHSFTPVQDLGRQTSEVEQSWALGPAEALYGGGSYQNGFVNYRNAPVQMIQFNTEAVVPFFQSTLGYGILWDNYAWSFLNPPEEALVEPQQAIANGSITFTPLADGDHFVYVGPAFPKAGEKPSWSTSAGPYGTVQVSLVDAAGREVRALDWDRLPNLPASLTGRAPGLKRGERYTVRYSWTLKGAGLFVQGPEYGRTSLRSALGDLVDYYFVYGGSADGTVAGYRELTGAAPLYGRWTYGFWQCKEHYDTREHLLAAAHGFRKRSIPVDAIVQDWLYWGDLGWGPQWDPKAYPDPAGMVRELRSLGLHFMVSVWSKFDTKTAFYRAMNGSGWLLNGSIYYDAWNPAARKLFYSFSKAAHFDIGVDSLWLDATEPEEYPNAGVQTHLGTGNAYMNTYSLATTAAISDGLRRDFPEAQGARVFSLTRSSFAGQQRTGATLWTGDIGGTWDSLRRQIASAINYQLSGMPYWSEDIGGFFRPKGQYTSADYRELLTRWFQFGAFTPIFRVHGAGTTTELWNYGEDTMKTINASAVSLRYRLLPYIYSGFARVDSEGYTMLRGLAMDFGDDRRTWNIPDEFMWGDAFLVTPIYTPMNPGILVTTRRAYLPPAASWVNFHTGEAQAAGEVDVAFALHEAPVFVRAGSIVVMGPLLQHTDARPPEPLEVRVYPGASAEFTLFEDDGVSTAYRSGKASTIRFTWDDVGQVLTVGERQGCFPGMLESRSLHVTCVAPGHGVGAAPAAPDHTVRYTGTEVAVRPCGAEAEFI